MAEAGLENYFRVDEDGRLIISPDSAISVEAEFSGEVEIKNDTGNPVPVSSTTLATQAKQDTGNTSVANLDTNTGAIADAAVTAGATGSISAKLRRLSADIGTLIGVISGGALKVVEQYAPVAEDNANGVIAGAIKPIASSTYSGTAFIAPLNDVDISVKATAGNVLSVSATNMNAGLRYLQLFNKASAPSGGDTAVFSFAIPAGSATFPGVVEMGREFFGENGHHFSTGIAVGISTVAATFTAATTTDHVVNGTYV